MKTQMSTARICFVRLFLTAVLLYTVLCTAASGVAGSQWPGVDEAVVEKIAKEHGREAREPLINTDQGDVLLFVFLLAGTAGGFAAGYCWRMLLVEKSLSRGKETNRERNARH